jgi:hypothetical protein
MTAVKHVNHFLVVHCDREPYDVHVGRGTPFGNPFSHLPGTPPRLRQLTREDAIEAFEDHVRAQPELLARIKAQLRGKILGCHCAPLACHADILARIANDED